MTDTGSGDIVAEMTEVPKGNFNRSVADFCIEDGDTDRMVNV